MLVLEPRRLSLEPRMLTLEPRMLALGWRMPHPWRRKTPTRPQDRLTAVGLRIKSTPNPAAAGQLVVLPVGGAVSAMQAGAVSAGQAGDHSSAAVKTTPPLLAAIVSQYKYRFRMAVLLEV